MTGDRRPSGIARVVMALAALAGAACGDVGTGVADDSRLIVKRYDYVFGDTGSGLQVLGQAGGGPVDAVWARVVDANGAPIAGRTITATVRFPGGPTEFLTATTDAYGNAEIPWRTGADTGTGQITVASGPRQVTVTTRAFACPPADTVAASQLPRTIVVAPTACHAPLTDAYYGRYFERTAHRPVVVTTDRALVFKLRADPAGGAPGTGGAVGGPFYRAAPPGAVALRVVGDSLAPRALVLSLDTLPDAARRCALIELVPGYLLALPLAASCPPGTGVVAATVDSTSLLRLIVAGTAGLAADCTENWGGGRYFTQRPFDVRGDTLDCVPRYPPSRFLVTVRDTTASAARATVQLIPR